MTIKPRATVIGAGLAGCEAAYQLSRRGVKVSLYEMKPKKLSPAHKSGLLCELVCSNSLRSDRLENAAGLLKSELRSLDSLIMRAADSTCVPAGGALAVDRTSFSEYITRVITRDKNIELITKEVEAMLEPPVIIATGPLTAGGLYTDIEEKIGVSLHFYDAAAPIIYYESIDMSKVFRASRYDRGADYLNCPMTEEEYERFYEALIFAETAPLASYETEKVFEGCVPVEVLAKRGRDTLVYGPMKPVGLVDERTGKRCHAVVQLRQDDLDGTLYNVVGFQTNLKFGEQKRVFSMIPGLENVEFARFGVMHRNTFLNSPGKLSYDFQLIDRPGVYFAGQITGVEGYVESAASGFAAGVNLARALNGEAPIDFTRETAIGALSHYVSGYKGVDFQPMNINFGIMEPLGERERNKQKRYLKISERALSIIEELKIKELKNDCQP